MDIKTKYSIGDTVFYMKNIYNHSLPKIKSSTIHSVFVSVEYKDKHTTISYRLDDMYPKNFLGVSTATSRAPDTIKEENLFTSKEELLKAL